MSGTAHKEISAVRTSVKASSQISACPIDYIYIPGARFGKHCTVPSSITSSISADSAERQLVMEAG